MGTQLLFIDISDAFGLLVKQLKGHLLTKRERKKMKQTLIDIATLVPVTILMLIPVRINCVDLHFPVNHARTY